MAVNRAVPERKVLIPGSTCIRQPNRYLQAWDTVISKTFFKGLCGALLNEIAPGFKVNPIALLALQEATERYGTAVMSDANLCAEHAGRITVTIRDLHLAKRLRG